jgi:hypothetical protein
MQAQEGRLSTRSPPFSSCGAKRKTANPALMNARFQGTLSAELCEAIGSNDPGERRIPSMDLAEVVGHAFIALIVTASSQLHDVA